MGSSANDALVGMSAFVTGGAGGIGGASARWLARDGASVTIMGRTEEKLRNTVKREGDPRPISQVQEDLHNLCQQRGGAWVVVLETCQAIRALDRVDAAAASPLPQARGSAPSNPVGA